MYRKLLRPKQSLLYVLTELEVLSQKPDDGGPVVIDLHKARVLGVFTRVELNGAVPTPMTCAHDQPTHMRPWLSESFVLSARSYWLGVG